MFGKNNKMSYCQESPCCRAGVRECCICYSVCIINSWLGVLQLKCEMSGFINETDSAEGVMKTDWLGVLSGCRWVLLCRTSMIKSRDVHWLQNL